MHRAVLADIGSTYTKVTLVDLDGKKILGHGQSFTTVTTNIADGLAAALGNLGLDLASLKQDKFRYKLACSSAYGGLKMVAVGLVSTLTVEAAKQAALGAGARVMKVYANKLIPKDIEELIALEPDLLLLAGGTDGGNEAVITHNAKLIAESFLQVPIILAGNKVVQPELEALFTGTGKEYYITENVMPELNQLNIEPCRKTIRRVFLQKIIEAKGLKQVEAVMDQVLMPTPAAVLQAATLLAQGYQAESGLGELLLVDIGGATTDVYSIAAGTPTKPGVNFKGLPEPFAKRTVEGDVGMRYSALALCENLPQRLIHQLGSRYQDILEYAGKVHANPNFVAKGASEELETLLGKLAVKVAVTRHVGHLEVAYGPFGAEYLQFGKDLTNLKTIIGTGGVLVNHSHPEALLKEAQFEPEEPTVLRPQTPNFYLDQHYILASMGLLAEQEPLTALTIMKQGLKQM